MLSFFGFKMHTMCGGINMHKIKLVAKITDDLSIKDKMEKGANAGEWQILNNNFELTDYSLPITSVHTSLANGEISIDDCFICSAKTLEKMNETRRKMNEAFQFAETIAKRQNHRVAVVAHIKERMLPGIRSEIVAYLQDILKKYPDCDLALENSMLLNGNLNIRSGVKPEDVPGIIKYLRDIMSGVGLDHRIYSVLDICHAVSTIRCINTLIHGFKEDMDELEELEKYFINTAPYCKIVHFNYLRNLGFGEDHGTTFSDSEIEPILNLFLKYTPDADLVIEIREDDYNDSKNFKLTVKQIKDILER